MNVFRRQIHRGRFWVIGGLTFLVLTVLAGLAQAQVRLEMRPFESMTLTGDDSEVRASP